MVLKLEDWGGNLLKPERDEMREEKLSGKYSCS